MFTDKEQQKIDTILKYLEPHDILQYDRYKQVILNNNEMAEYWFCDNDECLEIALENFKKENPDAKYITSERVSNDSDHDSFEFCNICLKPLNKDLTWYEDELDFLIEYCKTKYDLILPENAFKIVGLFESIGWLSDCLNDSNAKSKLFLFLDKILKIYESK